MIGEVLCLLKQLVATELSCDSSYPVLSHPILHDPVTYRSPARFSCSLCVASPCSLHFSINVNVFVCDPLRADAPPQCGWCAAAGIIYGTNRMMTMMVVPLCSWVDRKIVRSWRRKSGAGHVPGVYGERLCRAALVKYSYTVKSKVQVD